MSLTIKQAFEALSDACANGMKNPFFVMRRLKESFADVASKIKVDDYEDTYSTIETKIGKWIDNKTLFRKVVTSTTAPTADTWSTVALPADISVKMFDAYYVRSTGVIDKFSSYRGDTSPAEALLCSVNNSNAEYRVSTQFVSNFSEFRIIIYYTKSST